MWRFSNDLPRMRQGDPDTGVDGLSSEDSFSKANDGQIWHYLCVSRILRVEGTE